MPAADRRLDSWKEIAQYLGRGVSTVRRWEEERGLPVHRVPGGSRQSVYAYPSEIDSWLGEHGEEAGPSPSNLFSIAVGGNPVPSPLPLGPVPVPASPRTPPKRTFGFIVAVVTTLAIAVILYLSFGRPETAPRVLRYTQLTNDGEAKAAPLVTDGIRLFFNEGTSEASVISQVPLAGGRPVPVPGSTGLRIEDISPNGRSLIAGMASPGATTVSESPLYLLPLAGGPPHQLGISAHAAAWSPDGAKLAFAKGTALYVSKVDGTESRKLADVPGISWIRWTPDGAHLRLCIDEPSRTSIWQISNQGRDLQPLLPRLNPAGRNATASWTPDGRYFLIGLGGEPNGDLWAVRERRGILDKADPVIPLASGPLELRGPVGSKDGKKVFALGRLPRGELLRQDAGSRQFLSWLPGVSADGVAFSPDGQAVVYSLYPERTLWRSRTDGGGRVQLTTTALEAVLPRWAPDGRSIAFMARTRQGQGHWNIYRIAASGGRPEPLLPDHANHASPSWSPDGNSLAFAGAAWMNGFSKDSTAVQILDLHTQRFAKLPGSEGLWAPKWSPDGRHLAAQKADSEEIMLHDFETGRWESLAKVTDQGIIGYVCWSHTGDSIYFNTIGRPGLSIYRLGLQDRRMELVANLYNVHLTESAGEWFGLAPDDSPLVMRDTSIQEIYALDVDFP